MKQALHIFRKDARRFAYEIGVMAALTAGFAWSTVVSAVRGTGYYTYAQMAPLVLPVAWWYIIALLIHEEALTGDRRFWITRPYSLASLVSAKVAFVVLFMSVPLTIAQCAILSAAGFPPLGYVPELLWVQFVLAGTMFAPAFAFASLTRTLVQFVLTILGTCLGLFALSLPFSEMAGHHGYIGHHPPGLAWSGSLVGSLSLAVPGLVAIVLQWITRRRMVAVGAGLAAFAVLSLTDSGLSRAIGTAVQSRMFGERGAETVALTLKADDVSLDTVPDGHGNVALSPRLRATRIPQNDTVSPEIVEMTVERAGGERWWSGWTQAISSEYDVFQKDPDRDGTFAWWQRTVVDGGFYRRARLGPVTIRGSVWLMVNERRVLDLPPNRTIALPEGGRCVVSTDRGGSSLFANCLAPFHAPFNNVDGYIARYKKMTPIWSDRLLSYWNSPLPAESQMSPLFSMGGGPVQSEGSFVFLRYEPRAYIRRWFEVKNVRLP